MATISELVKATEAEIKAALDVQVDGKDFYGRAGLTAGDVAILPLRANISPDDGGEKVGIGYQLSEQPRDAALGGQMAVRRFSLGLTVAVRVELGYTVLLAALENLVRIGPDDAGKIGDSTDSVEVMEFLSAGSDQELDEDGNFTATLAFDLTIA